MPRVSKQKMDEICDLIMQGNPIKGICKGSDMPSYMTFLRHVQEDEDAHALYERARAIQCEVMHDEILDMVTAPLPDDKQLANAEVQRRRLEADVKDKYIRQMASKGVRNKAEDKQGSGQIAISWAGGNLFSESES